MGLVKDVDDLVSLAVKMTNNPLQMCGVCVLYIITTIHPQLNLC